MLDSVCHNRPFWLPTKHTSILPHWLNSTHLWAEEGTPASCSRLQCSLGVRRLLETKTRGLCAAASARAREPAVLDTDPTRHGWRGPGRPHAPGLPERARASLDELVQKCSVLQQLILGCPVPPGPQWPVSWGNSNHRLNWKECL